MDSASTQPGKRQTLCSTCDRRLCCICAADKRLVASRLASPIVNGSVPRLSLLLCRLFLWAVAARLMMSL